MAIAQTEAQQTSPPYALIVFAFLTVVLAAAAVWMYTKWDKSKKDLAEVQSRQTKLLKANEARDEAIQEIIGQANTSEGSPSVVKYLLDERTSLRSRLVSDASGTDADIQKQIDGAIEAAQSSLASGSPTSFSGRPLAEVIKTLSSANSSQRQALEDLDSTLTAAQASAVTAQNRLVNVQSDSEAKVAQIRSQMQARREKLDKDLALWNSALAKVGAELKNMAQALRTAKDMSAQEVEKMQGELTDSRKRLQNLIEKVQQWRQEGGIEFTGMVSKADGKIISVIPGQDIALIDIGEGSHLPLSLQFEVFGGEERITDETKSKATIQVVRVRDGLSECQIVRLSKGKAILPGDLIVNSVYDRQNKYVFRVIGEFDIDGSGSPDVGGARNLEGLIDRWGGQVVDNLHVQTDFLVVGEEPEVPAEPDMFDQAAVALYEQKKEARAAYMAEQGRATELSIPILNHKRFLYLLGKGNRSELEIMKDISE